MKDSAILRKIRLDLGLSQAEMGEALGGVKQGAYSNYENETRPLPAGMLEKAMAHFKKETGKTWAGAADKTPESAQAAPFYKVTQGFPEKEIVKATELVIELMGAGKLTPYKMGGYIATVAEMLVLGETESEIRALLGPPIRSLALTEVKRPQ